MRTSLNEIKEIEDHLFNYSPPANNLLFSAKMILDAQLRQNVALQQSTYQAVQQYGRKSIRAEIEAVHQKLMQQPQHRSFMQKLIELFRK